MTARLIFDLCYAAVGLGVSRWYLHWLAPRVRVGRLEALLVCIEGLVAWPVQLAAMVYSKRLPPPAPPHRITRTSAVVVLFPIAPVLDSCEDLPHVKES